MNLKHTPNLTLSANLKELNTLNSCRRTLKKQFFHGALTDAAWLSVANTLRIELNALYEERARLKNALHKKRQDLWAAKMRLARLRSTEKKQEAFAVIAKLSVEDRELLKANLHLL